MVCSSYFLLCFHCFKIMLVIFRISILHCVQTAWNDSFSCKECTKSWSSKCLLMSCDIWICGWRCFNSSKHLKWKQCILTQSSWTGGIFCSTVCLVWLCGYESWTMLKTNVLVSLWYIARVILYAKYMDMCSWNSMTCNLWACTTSLIASFIGLMLATT